MNYNVAFVGHFPIVGCVVKSKKMNLTLGEIQGCLRQVLQDDHPLSAEQRYSLMATVELVEFMKKISPGLGEAVKQMKAKMG